MTQEELLNVLSEHRLSEGTLDFLEHIKFKKYDRESLDKFKRIAYINKNPKLVKKIVESQYEMGFCTTYALDTNLHSSDWARSLNQLNQQRKSVRKFAEVPLSLADISAFFQLCYTLTGQEELNLDGTKLMRKKRNIASGGSLYPTELYFINHRIKELPLGVYRYNVFQFNLELITAFHTSADWTNFYEIILKTPAASIDFERASAFVVFTSVLNKHSFKYQDFGVALSLVEVGACIHAGYLAAAALDLGCCAFGGFLNKEMHQLLALKNTLHQPLFCMAIGHQLKSEV